MKKVIPPSFLALLAFLWLGSNCCCSARSPIVIRKYLRGTAAWRSPRHWLGLALCDAGVADRNHCFDSLVFFFVFVLALMRARSDFHLLWVRPVSDTRIRTRVHGLCTLLQFPAWWAVRWRPGSTTWPPLTSTAETTVTGTAYGTVSLMAFLSSKTVSCSMQSELGIYTPLTSLSTDILFSLC